MGGPCTPWVTVGQANQFPDAAGLDDDLLQTGINVASEILYRLSGRQFPGVCSDVVRPLKRLYVSENAPWWSQWLWSDGPTVHTCGRPPSRNCGCGPLPEITLGAGPIREIVEVRIDGAVLDPSAYRVDDRRWLVRVDGDSWPCCQSLDADPLTDPNTFQVTFGWGEAPPESGVTACTVLAIELAKSLSGSPCNLPQRLQSVNAGSMSYVLADPMLFFDKGLTGIYLVDLFLKAVNPNRLARRSSVVSPDFGRPVRRTAVAPGS